MNRTGGESALARIEALAAAGQAQPALDLALQAIAGGSKRMAVHFRAVAACLKLGDYRQALALTLAAASLVPATPAELVELAKRLVYFNQSETLRELAGRLLAKPVWHAAAEADFAALLSMVGEQQRASALLDRAIAITGPNPGALYNRSQLHLYCGRLDRAEADLRHCLRLEPGLAKAHWALGKLPRAATSDAELAALRRLAERVAPGSQDEVYLRFALFNQLDVRGDTDQAWQQLQLGCKAKRRLLAYDPAATGRLFDALRALPPPVASAPPAPAGPGLTPVFIVGMHRSGTTLLERLLGNHDQVSEGGELYDFPAQLRWGIDRHFSGPTDLEVAQRVDAIDFPELGRRYLDQVRWRAGGRPFLVDKLPSNFLNIGYLQRALPQARVIHMRRDAMDTCWSNLKELFSNACAYSYDQAELADYFGQQRRLVAHWQQQAPGYVLEVSYEQLAREPRAQAERILAFCGLAWQDACADVGSNDRAVNTASSAQVREPIHQRGIGAWQRYARQLQPLAERLAAQGLA
jgi:tetratricopeptide (TPR) repeat protein